MVPTISLEPTLDFTVREMFESEFEEDKEIAQLALSRLRDLVEAIKPVLAYVDRPIDGENKHRVVFVTEADSEGWALALTREGEWARAKLDGKGFGIDSSEWTRFPFSSIVVGLEVAFRNATQKKETHLAALAARRDLLANVGAAIRGEKK